jgi:CTP synthase (UTP-ammonia lyase)
MKAKLRRKIFQGASGRISEFCLGNADRVTEYARNVCVMKDANSREIGKHLHKVIDFMRIR